MNAESGVVQADGETLEEAVLAAARALSVSREAIDFEYDRQHFASGASTVRILARLKSPEAIAADKAKAEAAPPPRSEPGRDRDRGRGDRRMSGQGDRGRGGRGRDGDRGRPPRDTRDRGPGRRDPIADKERDERLKEHARTLAERVKAGEGPQQIADLNSFERHLVHTVVAEAGGLASHSVGDDLRKTVHITKSE